MLLADALCYETLLAPEAPAFDWPDLDERVASSLCYTSGTTGNPKGVLYSHRSSVLHAMAAAGVQLSDALGGLGLGIRELGIVLEELGRALVPGPFWSAATLGRILFFGSGRDTRLAGKSFLILRKVIFYTAVEITR